MQRELLKVIVRGSEFSAASLPFSHTSVRYKKPIWLGTAPSKKFKVPPRTVIPENEEIELSRLVKNYKTYNKGILAYHAALNAKRSETAPEVIEEQKRIEQEDWEQSNFINNEWNAEVAAEREQRIAKMKEEKILTILAEKEAKELKDKEELERAELEIQAEIENSKTFITRDNIDEHIEKALSSHVDFNFAIDKNENVYQGLKSNPLNSKEVTSDQIAANN
ncbi:hypothetical protein M8J76_013926 [Diaphorina citri]|nr:hypothetical protein M8J76_013926 [Diaphorina citri]